MKYQKITIEVPALTDEAAAYLHPKKRSCTNPSPLKKERCSIR